MRVTGPIWALGLMSGTSMDGVDAALLLTDGEEIAGFGPSAFTGYSRRELKILLAGLHEARAATTALLRDPARWPLGVRAAAATATETHARAVEALARSLPPAQAPALVGFHGQTLAHRPAESFTLQVGAGARLAARLGLPVVGDFRSADMAAGGQGAPLVPAYHAALARRLGGEGPLAFLNIGGVANLTHIDPARGDLIAFDTGPGNALVNDWMAAAAGADYDENGAAALAGRADSEVVARLMADPFHAAPPPKSLDRDRFKAALDAVAGMSVADGAATLTAYTVEAVGRAAAFLPRPPARWLLCGGGRRNRAMREGLSRRLNAPVETVEAAGFDGDMLEAQAFAFLAVRVVRGLPTSFPSTTGCAAPVCGGRLHLPEG